MMLRVAHGRVCSARKGTAPFSRVWFNSRKLHKGCEGFLWSFAPEPSKPKASKSKAQNPNFHGTLSLKLIYKP